MNLDAGTIVTSVLSSLVVGIGASWLTFRLQFERFKSMDTEREKHWEKWRDSISADVEVLKKSASLTELALIKQSVDMLIKRFDQLDAYTEKLKHVHIDPLKLEFEKLRQKVDEMEGRG